jgi:uncharacterized protein YbjT (DUF2867 family)
MTFIITVFGAGGKTGQECVKAALAKGDSVRAVVRDVKKYEDSLFAATAPLSSSSEVKLELIAGDVTSPPEQLKNLLAGSSAVIFAASASKTGSVWEVDRDGLANVAAAAKDTPTLGRVIVISSALVSPHNGWHPVRMILNNIRGRGQKIMDAKFDGENLLRAAGCDYIVIRPGGLTDAAPLGASALKVTQGDRNGASQIARRDVAELCVAAAHVGSEAARVTLEVCSDARREKTDIGYESLFVGLEKDQST